MTDASIRVSRGGPYLVSGAVPLRRKRQVETGAGEPITWQSDPVIEESGTYALCRCGHSGNKPYCDGSHSSADVDLTESAPTAPYEERAERLEGDGITMLDDEGICEHAGFCGNERTHVWAMVGDTDDVNVKTQLIGMVERCPSGRLTYEVDGARLEPDLAAEVGVVDDGPLYVTGGVAVERADGEPFETRNRMTLCRCGASGIKPLCDGSHKEIGFSDAG